MGPAVKPASRVLGINVIAYGEDQSPVSITAPRWISTSKPTSVPRRPIIAVRDRPDRGVVRVRRQSEQHEPGGEEVLEETPRRADEADHERTPSERGEWRRFDQVTRRCRHLVGGELGDPIATPLEALGRATVAAAPLDEGVGDLARSGRGLHGGARSARRPRLRAAVARGRLLELDSFVDVIVGHRYAKRTGHGDVPSGHRR